MTLSLDTLHLVVEALELISDHHYDQMDAFAALELPELAREARARARTAHTTLTDLVNIIEQGGIE